MEIFLFALVLLVGLALVGGGVYIGHLWDTGNGVALASLGIITLVLSIGLFSSYNIDKAKVEALVESGKYEVVTNEEYSLKELEQFMKVGGYYLKEVE